MGHGTPWTAPADEWCRNTASEMRLQGYAVGAIITKLTAYGCGLYAAQALASGRTK